MKILAVEKENPAITKEQLNQLLKEEAKKVWELVQSGIIREIYFTKDEHCAVIILECEDGDEAKSILNTLPLVKEGFISFEITPLVPYDGFERLYI
jgi:muconolactone delta-isomerase